MVGVPLIVIVLPENDAVTPEGNPVGAPIPVVPVVVCVIFVIAVFTQVVAEPGPVTVFVGSTVIVPVAFTVPQPPVNGMV